MKRQLSEPLKKLRLSGLAESLEVRLQEARANRLGYDEFLELVLQDELTVRENRAIQRRIKAASFRELKTLDDFDWDFNRSIKKKQIFDLAAGDFLRNARGVLFSGPPGTGKSFLSQAIGLALIRAGHTVLYRSIFDAVKDLMHDETFDGHDRVMSKYLRPDLLILDDMGIKTLKKRGGEFLFEIIMRRHEVRSTIMTTNRPLEDWGKLIGDVPAATAILDRFLQHADLITITGKSYRLRSESTSTTKETKQ